MLPTRSNNLTARVARLAGRVPTWILPATLLAGCDTVVMNPSGDIAAQQAQLIVTSTVLMLLIIVPVIVLTLVFAWRYRASNTDAPYSPDWDHSTRLELVIWGAPLLIIIALGALTWINTHKLDPWRPLQRIDAERPLDPAVAPMVVQVVALDWKWLFLYPDQGVGTVNQLVIPAGVPVHFKLTSASVMNTFFVPQLGSMVYVMNGMQTELHLQADREGDYFGLSAHFSGDGFSDMNFRVQAVSALASRHWRLAAPGSMRGWPPASGRL